MLSDEQGEAVGQEAGGRSSLIAAFGDEIADDLDAQVRGLEAEGIRRLDLRGVWGKNVLALSDDEVTRVGADLTSRGMRVSCVASPIGKAAMDGDFDQQIAGLRRALEIAHALGTRYVRVFSWYVPPEDDADGYREVVLERMGQLVRLAEAAGVVLLHENEGGLYGDSPARCHDLLTQLDSPALRAVWDPGNFVAAGYDPLRDSWPLLQGWIDYVHVKDVRHEGNTRRIVVAGEGEVRWAECIATLDAAGYRGVYALEPHLAVAGPASGFSGPDLFHAAASALIGLLAESTASGNAAS
jgi:3-dehydroshikimate dehydratase